MISTLITIRLRQVHISNSLQHVLAIAYMLYGIWRIKNSDFWMCLPIVLKQMKKKELEGMIGRNKHTVNT